MLTYWVLMDGDELYQYCFTTEAEAAEEGYKMGMTNVYVYEVIVAT